MNRNRRSRLNLSLVRRSESPKSPVGERPQSVPSDSSSAFSTPLNSRKRNSIFSSDGSPVLNDYDQSPVPLSQDVSNVVTGVSWAWNSPKRSIASVCHQRTRTALGNNNVITNKKSEFTRKERKKTVERLTGFYKFQSELKLLQESECRQAGGSSDAANNCHSMEVVSSEPHEKSPDRENVTALKPRNCGNSSNMNFQSDSFNDSAFDNLLMQASQAAEEIIPTETNGSTSIQTASSDVTTVVNKRSLVKSRTVDLDGTTSDSLNDSDLDLILLEASKMVETAVGAEGAQKQTLTNIAKKLPALTRHKSMPATPAKPNIVTADVNSGASFQPERVEHAPRLCTKEEIEQKRLDALKKQQARRLNRLMINSKAANEPRK